MTQISETFRIATRGRLVVLGTILLLLCGGALWFRQSLTSRSAPLELAAADETTASPQSDRSSTAIATSNETDNPTAAQLPRVVDIDGIVHEPGRGQQNVATVFVFLSTQCPISNAIIPELNRLRESFPPSIVLFGVIPDRFTTRDEAVRHRASHHIAFPIVLDAGGELQSRLMPTHTPQAIVLDATNVVIYSGAIDDRYREPGRAKLQVDQRYLQQSLLAVMSGGRPQLARSDAVGCRIEPRSESTGPNDITYCRDVAPIFFANCVRCHRAGESAPFPLMTYDDARRRAAQIAEVVTKRIMPPWKPVAGFGHFANDLRLSDREVETIARWSASGAPPGDEKQLPPLPKFSTGWQLGEPDLVLEMPEEFEVPADGPDIYRHFVLPTGLLDDQLVAGFEFRPGTPGVVHHSFLYFDTTREARRLDARDPQPGYGRFGGPGFAATGNLGGWAPGGLPRKLPEDIGRLIPANSDLVLQVHYHPTGKPERDRSKVGIYFAKNTAKPVATEIMVADVDLEIPAGAARHEFKASYTLPVTTTLIDCTPHMHLLGREIKVTATKPDGAVIPLIWIDDWNFFWQEHYVFQTPIVLPAGTRIDLAAWYDNSAGNLQNPNSPPERIKFGEDSRDEMGICYFQVMTDSVADTRALNKHTSEYFEELLFRYNEKDLKKQFEVARKNELRRAKLEKEALPEPYRVTRTITDSLEAGYTRIPSGTFWMGAMADETYAHPASELPRHQVKITRPYWIGETEVTVGQFREFVRATGYRTDAERSGQGCNTLNRETGAVEQRPECIWSSPGFPQTDEHPVVCVSWNDAVAYCNWLSERENRVYRLPTEAEWEFACRAGSDQHFFTGSVPDSIHGVANAGDAALRRAAASIRGGAIWDDGHAFTAPVASFKPNPFFVYDMHGNVGEWCSDWFAPYSAEPATDPAGPSNAESIPAITRWHVVRGGSWYNTPTSCRSACRHDGVPTAASTTNGFRVVLEADPTEHFDIRRTRAAE